MICLPPRPTLFPYTTLFRSLALRPRDPRYNAIPLPEAAGVDASVAYAAMRSPISNPFARFQNAEKRSEEHTSELQSLRHLVCRLLLEKKKKKTKIEE